VVGWLIFSNVCAISTQMKPINDLPQEMIEDSQIKWDAFCSAAKDANISLWDDSEFMKVSKRIDDPGEKIESGLQAVWLDLIEEEQGRKVLAEAGFENPDHVMRVLDDLRKDPETRLLSSHGRNRLDMGTSGHYQGKTHQRRSSDGKTL